MPVTTLANNIPTQTPSDNATNLFERLGGPAPLAIIFAVALAARVWFNFCGTHVNAAFSCDAAEYVRDAQGIFKVAALPATFWLSAFESLFTGVGVQSVQEALSPLRELTIAGPVFPLFIAISFALCGQVADFGNTVPPLIAQCILTSLTCVLVARAGQLIWGRGVGLTAGLLAALYPGFIVNSGRLYSESFSCFLVSAVVVLGVRGLTVGRMGVPSSLLLGVSLAALQMSRSVMVLATVLTLLVVWSIGSGLARWRNVTVVLCGFALTFVPWLCVQKMAFGSASMMVDRAGGYNLFIGTNTQTAGWLSYPYPDGSKLQDKGMIDLMKDSIKTSPSRWFRLMLEKPVRLLKMPWNDFRVAIGPFGIREQVWCHQLLLLFAGVGVVVLLGSIAGRSQSLHGSLIAKLFVLAIACLHLIYLLFITVPRYYLCAMPCTLLLAASAMAALGLAWKNTNTRKNAGAVLVSMATGFIALQVDWTPLILAIAGFSAGGALIIAVCIKTLAIVFLALSLYLLVGALFSRHAFVGRVSSIVLGAGLFVFGCVPLAVHGRWFEWSAPLSGNRQISQVFELTAPQLKKILSRPLYLLIDSNGLSDLPGGVSVAINGMKLAGPVIPVLPFMQDLTGFKLRGSQSLYLECEDIVHNMAATAGRHLVDLRQWVMIPIDTNTFHQAMVSHKQLTIVLTGTSESPCTAYGGYFRNNRNLTAPCIDRLSWEKAFYGVESIDGLSDLRYDQDVPSQKHLQSSDLSSQPGRQTGAPFVLLLSSPGGRFKTDLASIANAKARTSAGCIVFDVPVYDALDVWCVRVKGKVRCPNRSEQVQLGTRVTSMVDPLPDLAVSTEPSASNAVGWGTNAGAFKPVPGAKYSYFTPWIPNSVDCTKVWKSFDYAFPLQPAGMPGKVRSIEAQFVSPSHNQIEVSEMSIDVSLMPGFPTGLGYELY